MKLPDGHGSVYKEVRFSPTLTPIRRTQSLSGNTPSKAPNYQPVTFQKIPEENGFALHATHTAYLDQSRKLLEKQRTIMSGRESYLLRKDSCGSRNGQF
jgi:hypothetical protein